ncbi:ATP-dependent zinc metalloprotease YME1 homolog isoform X2 [Orussus abietinus]|uniref:ATP-dependent zinc metalloprotease YME1 homolog isoform X2 n=1 Tax=Orussus abietinus TaxID=222816 RepID=UPI000C715BD6|nr:ATP-dependent zinc metalloprotease YME1 homolog isoform X2 [Orussus abietinus]
MISLQSQNQVLYHLTQLTSTVTPRPSPFGARLKRRNESDKKTKDVVCADSFQETAKNCTEMSMENLTLQHLAAPLRLKRGDIWEILEQVSKGNSLKVADSNLRQRTSYVSHSSFAENKRHFPCSHLSEPIILPAIYISLKQHQHRLFHRVCFATSFGHDFQVRHFKTKRTLISEVERNPPFGTKFRKWIGVPSQDKAKDYPELEKVRNMLNDAELPAEEQQRVKVAFAEGYLAGYGGKSKNIFIRALKGINYGIMIGLVCSIVLIMTGTAGSFFRISIGNHNEVDPEDIHVTFNDVKGVDEAKQELRDVVEFLKNPDKFSALGGKLPKGVLLVGPPGTGKTLLARAVAGEAGVPFFHAAGPEFDEILVGQGARRVRDLFKTAKERAPCVVFIDEIDSVGAKRTTSVLHPYANQTINQLLSEMDGFHQNEGVIVLGATNRREDLDRALMRPGRFDVEIVVNPPDYNGRKEILDLYLSRVLTHNVDVDYLARCTTGFTGADLENMINQAAVKAALDGAESVTMEFLERARDKVLLGPEGKKRMQDEEVNRITAYHESGHALVAYFTKDSTPIHKVTIVPRGHSLGRTSFLPEKDVYHTTKSQLLAMMDTAMGGRAAEELIFGPDKVTTGAYNDFERATEIAEGMVKKYGMSEKVGFRAHKDPNSSYSVNNGSDVSPGMSELIDSEVKRLLQESYDRAKTILKNHAKEHKQMADALLKYETLDLEDVKAIVNGKKTKPENLTNNDEKNIESNDGSRPEKP